MLHTVTAGEEPGGVMCPERAKGQALSIGWLYPRILGVFLRKASKFLKAKNFVEGCRGPMRPENASELSSSAD
jgi:hypothetical protein